MTRAILFVCTGNVCRSPMAAALFNAHAARMGEGHLYVADSAGTWALDRQPASGFAVTAMARRGINLALHRGREITPQAIAGAALVLVMTRNHLDALRAEFPHAEGKIHLMSELVGRHFDIADPYGTSAADYEACAAQLDELIASGYGKIKCWISSADSPI